ncbi:MAG: hypothetical protein F7B17_00690 [Desulfurococcales archaeon]|nr:hypothetical protein [Desulfurococcales archaeon]
MARPSLRRVVAEKLALTALIALIGSVLVALSSRVGLWLAFIGLIIVALSPAISYLIIIHRLSKKMSTSKKPGESGRKE